MAVAKLHEFVNGEELKRCYRCDEWKGLDLFHSEQRRRDGLANECKACAVIRGRNYRKRKPELWRRNAQKKRDSLPPGENAAKMREYRVQHPDRIKATTEKRYSKFENILAQRVSAGIRASLKTGKNGNRWESLVGYNLDALKRRLTSTLPNGYTMSDIGKLHIDHIIPISVFNITDEHSIDFKRCWSLDNLQLLPAIENIKKSAKLTKMFQPSLAISIGGDK